MGFLRRQDAEAYFAKEETDTLARLEPWKSEGETAVLVKEDAFHCEALVWDDCGWTGRWMRPDKGDSWWLKTLQLKQTLEGNSHDAGVH